MSFIDTLLYRKKHNKAQRTASKTESVSGAEDLTEDPEDEITNEYDSAPLKEDAALEEDSEVEYEVVEREILPAKIICPDCGGITLEGLEFCDKCGGELQ